MFCLDAVEYFKRFTLLIALVFLRGTLALKLLNVEVPKLVLTDEIRNLRCEYELGGDKLYSVLWYKDNEEFYRFVPRNEPKQHSYKMEGFRVEIRESNDHVVTLRNINIKASGVYKCEVSAEAPSFASVHGEGRMEVVAPPTNDPEILGDQKYYQIGDTLNLNCTSGKSYPSARMKWFINDLQVDSDYEMVFQHHGLLTSIVGLNLRIGPHHFVEGKMIVRCTSTIYRDRNSDSKMGLPIDRREAFFQVNGTGKKLNTSVWLISMAFMMCLM